MATLKEDYLTAMAHGVPESAPVFGKPVRFNFGLGDWFEKGPAGGGKDGFGVVWESVEGGNVPSTASFLLTDAVNWRKSVKFPDLDAEDWAAKAEKELRSSDRETQVLEYAMGNGPFERFLALMGYEELIYALNDEPEACHDFLDAWCEYKIKHIDLVAKHYRPDYITIYDDVAFEKGLFLSADMYREYIKPCHIRINKAIRERGITPLNHCCGKAESLIEDFIDENAQAWCSLQPANDIAALLKKYHSKMTFIGGYDSNGAPSRLEATEEQRRAEARRVIDEYAGWGSFILGNHIFLVDDPALRMKFIGQANDEAYTYGKNYYVRKGLR